MDCRSTFQAKEEEEYHLRFSNTICSISKPSVKLTVIFATTSANGKISNLSSRKVAQDFEELCPECIVDIRFNPRLDDVATDTRNGQTTLELPSCADFCGMPVKVY